MEQRLGLLLVAVFVGLAWSMYGWQGAVFGVTVGVFWMLLQFSRVMRVMRRAAAAPVGRVDSAVMLHSRLRTGLPLVRVIALAGSLGRKVGDDPERYDWGDASGARVTVTLRGGRCTGWTLQRDGEAGGG